MVARARAIADPVLSPDGTRVAFVSERRLVVVPVGGDGGELPVLTDPPPASTHPSGGGVVDWAGDELVFAARDGTVRAARADGGPARVVSAWAPAGNVSVSPDGTKVAYVIDGRDVAVVPVDGSAWPVKVSTGAAFALDPTWSPDSSVVAWHEWDDPFMPWDESRIATSDGRTIGGRRVAVGQPRFGPDGTLGHLGDGDDGWYALWCLREGHEHGTPAWGPGIRQWAWSPDGGRIAFVRNEAGFGRLCVLDRATGSVEEWGKGWHVGLSWRGAVLAAVRTGARTPPELVAYRGPGERCTLARTGAFPRDALVEPEPVEGGRVYAPGRDRPLLLYVHGGPTDQSRVEFNPFIAWFVDRGWAVAVVDHRGSTGSGRAHRTAMDGGWGEVDVEDAAAMVRRAATAGWADTTRAAAYGGSAGGFTALHLVGRHPDLVRAAVALYPVADLEDLAERTHRFERHYNDALVGTDPATVRARSPLSFADRITTPVLVLHGDADEVVPVEQSRHLAARAPGVELHVYEGEGHGFRGAEAVADQLERVERFLARHVLRWRP